LSPKTWEDLRAIDEGVLSKSLFLHSLVRIDPSTCPFAPTIFVVITAKRKEKSAKKKERLRRQFELLGLLLHPLRLPTRPTQPAAILLLRLSTSAIPATAIP
jgi:hypothetical protein